MNLFNSIRIWKPKRNPFNMTHEVKMSLDFGNLTPFGCFEVVPDDTWKMSSEVFLRFAPLIAPVMHRVNVFTHFFFVPNRIINKNWDEFITGGKNGVDAPPVPTVSISFISSQSDLVALTQPGTLWDYLGLPPVIEDGAYPTDLTVSLIPFLGFLKIYDEYYRDENLEDPLFTDDLLELGENVEALDVLKKLLTMRVRAWEKDYFTSALPWTQKGPDVQLPVGDMAPVVVHKEVGSEAPTLLNYGTMQPAPNVNVSTGSTGALSTGTGTSNPNLLIDPKGTLQADLSQASGTTVNELRRAIKIQEFYEKDARGGTRLIETLFSHFGVKSDDARLQRPEFLGGGKNPVAVSEVLQTSESTQNSPQASMAGHALSYGRNNSFKRYFKEHGYIIAIMSVMPRTAYQQGIPRHFLRKDRFDYYWPSFARLGEQAIYNAELYMDSAKPLDTFGYQSRYAEYKYIPSSVHGEFRSSLDFWHMGRIFPNEPKLNSIFVHFNGSETTNRSFAVEGTEDQPTEKLYCQILNRVKAVRPMPKYGTPML